MKSVLEICILCLWICTCSNGIGLRECCEVITTNGACNNTCVEVLSELTHNLATLSSSEISALSSACSSHETFWSCIGTYESINGTTETDEPSTTRPMSSPHTICCNRSEQLECTNLCFESHLNITEMLTNMQIKTACGDPPSGPFWTCLLELSSTQSSTDETTVSPSRYADWARLQCCDRAIENDCKTACHDLYGERISKSSFSLLQLNCIHRSNEGSLSTCLADVSGPCQLGCSGMNFCRNFNNRPLQFFRQCTTVADRLANITYTLWINNGRIDHPLITIPINNINECLQEEWKAVACITHLLPCHSTTHATKICSVDCIRLLEKCANSTLEATHICSIISSREHCISLKQFIQPSDYGDDVVSQIKSVISNPCEPNPCSEGLFCVVNHDCNEAQLCTKYECQSGCILGDRPGIVLPKARRVRVTVLSTNKKTTCYDYLNCSSQYSINGQPINLVSSLSNNSTRCEQVNSCEFHGSIYSHESKFVINCNYCTCYYGRLVCTNKMCGNVSKDCHCGNEYQPVCIRNGITIANECQANCFGYTSEDYLTGSCGRNVCNTECEDGSRCIPNRHSCLSNELSLCRQHKCEVFNEDLCISQSTPVCDTSSIQHYTLCSFLRSQNEFDYFGRCEVHCRNSNFVCGVNQETFPSKCHAHNAKIAVDYYTRCQSSPIFRCTNINCSELQPGCRFVIPPGACCPLCGTLVTLLIDETVLEDNLLSLGLNEFSSVDIIQRLEYYISYAECKLYGHLTWDGSFVLIVIPTRSNALLVVEVCHLEAVKLAAYINNRTPRFSSDTFFSHFIAAQVELNYKEDISNITTTLANGCTKYETVASIIFIIFLILI